MRTKANEKCMMPALLLLLIALGCGGKSASFVYVVTNPDGPNAVEAFRRDRDTGVLERIDRYPTGGTGESNFGGIQQDPLVYHQGYLYVVNIASDDISSFAVQKDGSLSLLGRTPSGGRRPVSLIANGNRVYVANAGNEDDAEIPDQLPGVYNAFQIAGDGTLQAISGAAVSVPKGSALTDLALNADGTLLFGARQGGHAVDVLSIQSTGQLVLLRTLQDQPGAFALNFSPLQKDQLFVALSNPKAGSAAPGVTSLRLANPGMLTPIDVSTNADTVDPCWLVLNSAGNRLWTSSFIPRRLTLYTVNETGKLTESSNYTPDSSGPGSTDIALSSDQRFMYQLRAFDVPSGGADPLLPHMRTLRITDSLANGGVELIQDLPMQTDLDVAGVMGVLLVDLG